MRAYLDIETSFSNELTVVGFYIADNGTLIQMIGEEITPETLMARLDGVTTLYTYNGNRFDLPMIRQCLGVNLRKGFESRDLMYDCWKRNLKGGLKVVERTLGIGRSIFGRGEDDPRILWRRYRLHRSLDALERLLEYNREDTLNLVLLEKCLEEGRRGDEVSCSAPVDSYVRLI
ncbi:MAG: ribonuclease H-like domain-containing protein [Actinobacteria bacterium]|nr:ribonuclease H-like domain-containing protein [Actinomycetota bacterium]